MLGAASGEKLEELPDLWEDFNLPGAVARCARNKESIVARVSYGESHLRINLECLSNEERHDVLVVMQDLSTGHRLEANQQRFLANAAHELKTPLMSILGAAELLATGEDENPAMRSRLLDHIFSESRRMQRLAEALLRLSRVGWDLREPNEEVVDLRAAGQRAAKLVEPLAESAGLRLNVEGEEARVRADPEWLQEVLLVLLSNAIKNSIRGGDIRLHVRGNAVKVEDEGVGINSVDLPTFSSVSIREREAQKVSAWGFRYAKSSPSGWKAVSPFAPKKASAQRSRSSCRRRIWMPKILIVEDDPAVRDILKIALEREGMTVEAVGNGEKALKSFREAGTLDLVILDIMLPDIDGITLCQEMRRSSDVPIVMLTAREGERKSSWAWKWEPTTTLRSRPARRR
jgi:CheY-like chemotaxis protein